MPDVISSGSVYIIDTTVKKEIDGVMCEARVKKVVHINFSETSYTVKARMDKTYNDIEVELIPESMNFLHELTDIFPLSEYNYKFIRPAKRIEEHKPFISIEIQVTGKATGTNKWLGSESIILSDKDYDHFRNILLQAFPEHEWKSCDTYVKFMVAEYMNDWQFGLAADARDTLIGLVVMRYKEVKKDGLVDFWGDAVDAIAQEIVTKAISEYSEKEGEKLKKEKTDHE